MQWMNNNGQYVNTISNTRISNNIQQYSLPGNNGLTRF